MNNTNPIPTARPSWLVTLLCLVVVVGGAIGAVALFGNSSADAATPKTQKIVIRPVTASGHAAKGYTVRTEKRTVRCWSDQPSPVAVDAGIAWCGGSLDYAVACWPSAQRGHVLCLSDPYGHTVRSLRLSGAFPAVRAPRHSQPQALTLTNGEKYLDRVGAAWGSPDEHPTWDAVYFQRSPGQHTIYGPGDNPINQRHKLWFVTTYRHASEHGTRHDVAKAYYVGTGR